jgi:cytidine deaminase
MHNLTAPDLTLLAFAREMKQKSYAPYSDFRVGAAIFANGDIFQGCNMENAAYGSTMCAEAAALAAAIAAGCHDIEAVAVVGDSESPTVPCGNCRQMLAEFNPEMRVIMGGSTDEVMVMTLEELLPEAFVRGFLDQDTNEPE